MKIRSSRRDRVVKWLLAAAFVWQFYHVTLVGGYWLFVRHQISYRQLHRWWGPLYAMAEWNPLTALQIEAARQAATGKPLDEHASVWPFSGY